MYMFRKSKNVREFKLCIGPMETWSPKFEEFEGDNRRPLSSSFFGITLQDSKYNATKRNYVGTFG